MASATSTAGTSAPSARPSDSASRRRRFSADAEALIARELTERGWTVLARNARFVGSELDLVVQKGRTLAVVEVKARRTTAARGAVDPRSLLPRRKIEALRRGALAFVTRVQADVDTVRLDLAVVQMKDGVVVTHVDYHAGIAWD